MQLSLFLCFIVGIFVGGISSFSDTSKDIAFRIGQPLIEALFIWAVNGFLIISGWFGLRLKFQSILKLWICLVCIYVPFQLADLIFQRFSLSDFIDNIIAFTRENYFTQCYLMLLFLSPIINLFINKYGRKILLYVSFLFTIEIVAYLIDNQSLGVNNGYSLFHFVLMYMLARCASLYKKEVERIPRKTTFIVFLLCTFCIFILHIVGGNDEKVYGISNPIIILQAFCLFFTFRSLKISQSKIINTVASHTFAVYIMHTCGLLCAAIIKADTWMLMNLNYFIYLPLYVLMCVIVFVACVVYDLVREKITDPFSTRLMTSYNKHLKPKFNIYL